VRTLPRAALRDTHRHISAAAGRSLWQNRHTPARLSDRMARFEANGGPEPGAATLPGPPCGGDEDSAENGVAAAAVPTPAPEALPALLSPSTCTAAVARVFSSQNGPRCIPQHSMTRTRRAHHRGTSRHCTQQEGPTWHSTQWTCTAQHFTAQAWDRAEPRCTCSPVEAVCRDLADSSSTVALIDASASRTTWMLSMPRCSRRHKGYLLMFSVPPPCTAPHAPETRMRWQRTREQGHRGGVLGGIGGAQGQGGRGDAPADLALVGDGVQLRPRVADVQ
jgi:hypothetical protein